MAKSEVGRKAEAVVAGGGECSWTSRDPAEIAGLVSDELMLEIVKTELDRLQGKVSSSSSRCARGAD